MDWSLFGSDWGLLIAAVIIGLLGLGLYACNWLSKYTTARHEEKLQARLEQRENAHRQRLLDMRAQQDAFVSYDADEEESDGSEIDEDEINEMMAASLLRLKEREKTEPSASSPVRKPMPPVSKTTKTIKAKTPRR